MQSPSTGFFCARTVGSSWEGPKGERPRRTFWVVPGPSTIRRNHAGAEKAGQGNGIATDD